MKKENIISWILQLCIVIAFAPSAYLKLTGAPESIATFDTLGMEPAGRYIIGFLEAAACLLLLTPNSVAYGSILTFYIMLGAILAHLTKLGFGESYSFICLALLVASAVITCIRKMQIKSIARMLN